MAPLVFATAHVRQDNRIISSVLIDGEPCTCWKARHIMESTSLRTESSRCQLASGVPLLSSYDGLSLEWGVLVLSSRAINADLPPGMEPVFKLELGCPNASLFVC